MRLKFYEFLHQIKVIFYFRFRVSTYLCMPHASKNENFRSKSPYPPLHSRVAQVAKLELPSFILNLYFIFYREFARHTRI